MNDAPKGRTVNGSVLLAATIATLLAAPFAQAAQRTLQLAEDGAGSRSLRTSRSTSLLVAPPTRVCEPGAKWVRLGFDSLVLKNYDSLTLVSSGGDRLRFEGGQWNNRAFHARALRGECVDIQASFGDPDSRYALSGYDFGRRALVDTPVVVAGAGDICDSGLACSGTSDLIVSINPTAVFTAGDNAYGSGTLAQYNSYYEPYWGRFKALTSPTPGNHEYLTTNAKGYFDYYNGVDVQDGPAGNRSKGYYSWDVGEWHFIALNTTSSGNPDTTQINWLKADLAANTKPCTAAYFHHPLVSRGNYTGYSGVKPFWDALYAAKADLVLNGHDHNYQRYAKMNPSQQSAADGIVEVLVGTGGRSFYGLSGSHPLLAASNANTHGVLKLSLTATGYTGEFVPKSGGGGFTDSFSGTCNKASGGNAAPVANFSSAISGLVVAFTDSSTDSDGTIASRSWSFGDGTTSTATNPSKTYTAAGSYTVTLTVTDDDGATNAKSATVTVGSSGNVLSNGVPVTGINGTKDVPLRWTMVVPAGATGLSFVTAGSNGDADLYVKFGSQPTTSSYDCKSDGSSSNETCNIATAQAGTYHVLVQPYASFTNLTLTGSHGTGGGDTQTYSNTADYTINDNATVDSPIAVSGRTGNAPANASITLSIVHTYRGDLKVDLVAPDGTLYNLHNRSGGSADNLSGTFSRNLSSEALNGTWKLRVNDNASGDTGKIDSWSITF
ncbi:proprotein convertase P-domain-containing protein [Montanilutibacter psychrotolerans]|uniref:proprotein convertase P-domain-containing protein n=1 Tax=Montanilutibacter psychrotolerans TaxID=1327343 RepID=UPI0016801257|nr:proprotein convertase P-domain-containing protein [Lysobacter psychrotolerans]